MNQEYAECQSGADDQHDHDQRQESRSDYAPLFAWGWGGYRQMTLEQCDVLHVRLPRRIEQVAKRRHSTDKRIDADVYQHSGQCQHRHFGSRGLHNDVSGEHSADQITNHRD